MCEVFLRISMLLRVLLLPPPFVIFVFMVLFNVVYKRLKSQIFFPLISACLSLIASGESQNWLMSLLSCLTSS